MKLANSRWVKGNSAATFKTLLISFIIVFFVPVIVAVVFYSRIEHIMIENAHRAHESTLERAKQAVDGYMNEINRLTMQIGFNSELKRYMERSDHEDPQDLYRLISFVNELSLYNSINPIIGQYYVYLHRSDTILAPKLKVDSETFYDRMIRFEGLSYEQFYDKYLAAAHYNQYYPVQRVYSGSGLQQASDVLLYVQSLPIGEKEEIQATFFVLIDEQKFSDLFQSIPYADDSGFQIIDKDGRVLLAKNSFKEPISPENHVTSRKVSDINGWTFLVSVPKHIVLAQVEEVKSHALLLFLLCFILGGAACYYLAFRNYMPVRKLLKSISELTDQREKLNTTLHQYLPIVRSDYLSRLIRGRIHSDSLNRQELEKMGVHLPHDVYLVVIAEIDDCSRLIREDSEQEWGLVRFIIGNAAVEMLEGNVYSIELDRHRMALLINTKTADEIREKRIRNQLEKWQAFLKKRLRTYITIGVSEMHEGIDKISQCYLEADHALEYKLVKGEGAILYYQEVSRLGTRTYYFPVEMEVQLTNFVKMSDVVSVERLLEQIYEMNFVRQSISPEMSKQLFNDLVSCLNKLAASLELTSHPIGDEWKIPSQVYEGCSSAEEMMERTRGMVLQLCEAVSATRTDSSERIYVKIKEYIDEHFRENSISLHSIAEHLNMSPSYLSVSFKKHSGQTISDYVLRVRIEHAKSLLSDHKLTITDIAQKVGYANNIGFIRAFKRLEGITPGQYRQSMS